MNIAGHDIAFGVKPEWATCPIVGLPEGSRVVKRRFRTKACATVFVRRAGVITQHYLLLDKEGLRLHWPCGMNVKEAA